MPRSKVFEREADRYDAWFAEHQASYQSELDAVRRLLPEDGVGMEIGVGSGRFAVPLGIRYGVDPSAKMRTLAQKRGIEAVEGVAEQLPYRNGQFDFALMVTTICFLDDVGAAFREAYRVVKPGGALIVGFIDRESPLGRAYEGRKKQNVFYRDATFYSSPEVVAELERAGFRDLIWVQTLVGDPATFTAIQSSRAGHGEGGFAVVRGRK